MQRFETIPAKIKTDARRSGAVPLLLYLDRYKLTVALESLDLYIKLGPHTSTKIAKII